MKKHLTLGAIVIATSLSAHAQTEKSGDFHLDKEYKMNTNGVVRLTASDANVFITGSTRNTAHVKIDRVVTSKGLLFGEEKFAVEVREEEGNLVIREKSGSNSVGVVGYYNEDYKITLELPEGASLEVRGDDGDYYVKNINGAIEIELDDADIELASCKGNNFKIRLDDGDLRMDTGKGSFELDADDADVKVENAAFEKIIADIDDGDFVVATSLSNKADYFINAQDGLVSLTVLGGGGSFDIRHDDGRVITEGDFNQVEESDDHTQVTLANGTAKVNIHTDDARVRLIR